MISRKVELKEWISKDSYMCKMKTPVWFDQSTKTTKTCKFSRYNFTLENTLRTWITAVFKVHTSSLWHIRSQSVFVRTIRKSISCFINGVCSVLWTGCIRFSVVIYNLSCSGKILHLTVVWNWAFKIAIPTILYLCLDLSEMPGSQLC